MSKKKEEPCYYMVVKYGDSYDHNTAFYQGNPDSFGNELKWLCETAFDETSYEEYKEEGCYNLEAYQKLRRHKKHFPPELFKDFYFDAGDCFVEAELFTNDENELIKFMQDEYDLDDEEIEDKVWETWN